MLQGTLLYPDGPKDHWHEQLEMLLLIAPLPGKPPWVQSSILTSSIGPHQIMWWLTAVPPHLGRMQPSIGDTSNIELTLKADLKKENLLRA